MLVDATDTDALMDLVHRYEPDAIAICAAWPHVDGCEREPARSLRENVGTVDNVIRATAGSACRILHYSSDLVFDGSKAESVESDPVSPLSVYGHHKRLAEELLLARGRALVVRTSWVFGAEIQRKNFACQVVDAAGTGAGLVVTGQVGCPTWSGWLADSALDLLPRLDGIVHLAGSDCLTRSAWATMLVRALGLPAVALREVPMGSVPQYAPRPSRITLKTERHALVQPPLDGILSREGGGLRAQAR